MDRRSALLFALLLAGCARSSAPLLRDLSGREDLSRFKVHSASGIRDGDHLTAQVLISDSSSILTVNLRFAVGSPTTLESGDWQWSRPGNRLQGIVSARSVTFLGGQDGPPSIGGTFDLRPGGPRLTLPLMVLPRSFRPAASGR